MNSLKTPFKQALSAVATTANAATTLVLTLATLAASFTALSVGSTGESGYTPQALPYGRIILTTAIFLVPLALAPTTRWNTGYNAALPPKPRLPRLLTATGLTWLAMGITGTANPWIRKWLGQEQWTGISATHPIGDADMRFMAINAGITEEAANIALPAGITYLSLSALATWRTNTNRTPLSHRTIWIATVLATLTFGGFTRYAGHLYQGPTSATLALLWGLALAVIAFWGRSVWPVMLGHVLYNWPVEHANWSDMISHHVITPGVISVLGLSWLGWLLHRRTQARLK